MPPLTKAYLGASQRRVYLGTTLIADLGAGSPPSFTTPPSFDAASYAAGATVTLSEGIATGDPAPTITLEYFTLDGVDRAGELVGLTWDSTGAPAGTLAAKFRATNSQGFVLSAEITASLTAAAIVPQTATIGALTLAGAGGYQITAGGSPITNAIDAGGGTATGYTLSAGGVITPTSNGSLSAQDAATINITCDQGSATITLAVEPDVYSVVPDASASGELGAVMALGAATVSGKTIKGRGGDQAWVNSTLNNMAFTAETRIMSHDDANRFTFTGSNGMEIRDPSNMTFDGVDFNWTFIKGTSSPVGSAITIRGATTNVRFRNCVATGGFKAALAAYGNPVSASDYSYRGWLGGDGNSYIPLGAVYEITDNVITDFWRAVNLPGGDGYLRFDRNRIFQCSVDHSAFAGGHPNGSSMSWNRVYDPINIVPDQYQVTNVDVANDQMTVATDVLGSAGATIPVDIGTNTTTVPGGLSLPGGGNTYSCTIVSVSAGSTVLQFPVDITSTGENVWVNREPDHADGMQFIPTSATYLADVQDLEIIGNAIYMTQGLDELWPQGIFMEDIARDADENHYYRSVIAGNIVYTGARNAILQANGVDSLFADNSAITPDPASGTAEIRSDYHYSWGGTENLMVNNVAAAVRGLLTNDGEVDSLEISSGFGAAGVFVDASTPPTDVDDLVARYKRTDLGGAIDYDASTYDLPSINDCAAIAFGDVTGMEVDTYAVSGPVQVTGIVNGQGAASAYGIRATAWGGSAPQMRVTSDAAGTTTLQDWTGGSSIIVQEGQYLWVRDMSPSSYSQTRNVFVRCGRQKDTFAVATMAAPAGLIRFAAATTNGSGGDTLIIDLAALGVATGDLVIAGYHSANNTSRAPSFLTAGYTETAALFANSANDSNMKLGYKLMGATPDADVQVDGTGASTGAGTLIVQVWRGVNQTTPVDVAPVTVTGINTRIPNPAAITPVTTGAKILVFGGAAHAEASALPLSADYLSAITTDEGVGGTYRNSALMGSVDWTSGAYDPAPLTISGDSVNDSYAAITLALRPA